MKTVFSNIYDEGIALKIVKQIYLGQTWMAPLSGGPEQVPKVPIG